MAKRLHCSKQVISHYENGLRLPSLEMLESMAGLFGVAPSYFMNNLKPTDAPRPAKAIPFTPARSMVPIVGQVRCGPGGALAFEDLQGAEMADVNDPSEYFYLRAVGDSMEPRIYPGDLVLIHAQPEVESGELAAIIIDEEDGVLKRYIERDGAIILQSYNPEYPPRVFVGSEKARIRIAGRAVQLVRKW